MSTKRDRSAAGDARGKRRLVRAMAQGLLGLVVLFGPAAAAAPAAGQAAVAEDVESRLLARLLEHVAQERLPVLTVSFGEKLTYEVRSFEGSELILTLRGGGAVKAPPVRWTWERIPAATKLDLLGRLPSDPDLFSDLARYCFRKGRDDEAHVHLRRIVDEDPDRKGAVDALLARELGVQIPPGGFEWLVDRYFLPSEKEEVLVRNAEAWLMARKAAEDEEHAAGEALFAKARWLQTKGFFELARGLFGKVARSHPETDIGRESGEKVEPNAFQIRLPTAVSGPPENRVDLVILGDGYQITDRHQDSFRRACDLVVDYLLEREVFAEYASYLNFWRIHVSSKESGVDNHTQDYSTALGGKWSAGSQGQVTVDHGLVREMLRRHRIPWDSAMVMVKRGGLGTGGGGICAFAHASTGTAFHELGHSFAGLLDEYSTQVSDTPQLGGAPRGPNIANSPDVEQCPWKHWIDADTPGVGLFRGGAGGAPGAFRPTDSGCVMNSGTEFCVVCREQVVLSIYRHVRPVERADPEPGALVIDPQEQKSRTFEVEVLKPASRQLEVTWTLNGSEIRGTSRELRDGKVVERLELAIEEVKIAPGYRAVVTARVRDTTPWVLRDDGDLLEQRVTWTLEHPEESEGDR